MGVEQWFTVVVTSWYSPLTERTVDDLLVVTVLAHIVPHVGSFELGVAHNAVVEFDAARHAIMRFFAFAYHLQVDLVTDTDFPFEWDVLEPCFRLLLGHGVEHAKVVAKVNGFILEFEDERNHCLHRNCTWEDVRVTGRLATGALMQDRQLRDAKFGHPIGVFCTENCL